MVDKVPPAKIKGDPTIRGRLLEDPLKIIRKTVQNKQPPEGDRHPSPNDPWAGHGPPERPGGWPLRWWSRELASDLVLVVIFLRF